MRFSLITTQHKRHDRCFTNDILFPAAHCTFSLLSMADKTSTSFHLQSKLYHSTTMCTFSVLHLVSSMNTISLFTRFIETLAFLFFFFFLKSLLCKPKVAHQCSPQLFILISSVCVTQRLACSPFFYILTPLSFWSTAALLSLNEAFQYHLCVNLPLLPLITCFANFYFFLTRSFAQLSSVFIISFTF